MVAVRKLIVAAAFALLVAPAALPADLDEAIRSLERIRGLRFRHPVTTVAIDRSELPTRLREQVVRSMPYTPGEWEEILEALLLVEPDKPELLSTLIDLYESQVLAYYDPATRTYYSIRQLPPAIAQLPEGLRAEQGVVVHELMHALQDQHFSIGAKDLALRHDADAALAYHALLEGEASLVMMAFMLEKAGADFAEVAKSPMFDTLLSGAAGADLTISSTTPAYFAEMLKFPYLEGLKFTLAAYRRGGWKELDRIHADPPLSTREILHPDDYFARRFARTPFSRKPAGTVSRLLSVEHLGEFHWRILAGAENARGWKSDSVTIAQNAACETTVLADTRWESAEAAQKFHDAYVRALDAKGVGAISSVDGDRVRVAYGADLSLARRFAQ
jgi:hypothetical protein